MLVRYLITRQGGVLRGSYMHQFDMYAPRNDMNM